MIKLIETAITDNAPIDEMLLFEIISQENSGEALHVIRRRWLGLDAYIFSLISYLNSLMSSDGEILLLQKCVNEGVRLWESLNDKDCDDKTRVAAFIRGTVHFIPEVLHWRVTWPEKPRQPNSLWNPYEIGLTNAWRNEKRKIKWVRKQGSKPEWANVSEQDFRSIILTKHLINDSSLMRSMAPQLGYLAGR